MNRLIISIVLIISNFLYTYDATNSAYIEALQAQSIPLVQLQFPYNLHSDYVTTTTTGLGAVTQSNNVALVQSGALATSSATLLSRQRLHSYAGQSCRVIFSARYASGVISNTQMIGVAGLNAASAVQDGFLFGYNGTTFGIFYYNNSTIPTFIAQSSWNDDVLDGTGTSGVTLDPTKGNVYKIQYQGAGYGAIKFYVENSTDGTFILVHTIEYPNANTVPTLRNASMQLYAQSANTLNLTNITMQIGGMAGMVDGLTYKRNQSRFSVAAVNQTVTNLLPTNILTLQNGFTNTGVANQVVIYPDFITIMNPSSSSCMIISLYKNYPSILPGGLVSVNANSAVLYGTIAITGTLLMTLYCSPSNGNYSGRVINFDLTNQGLNLNPGEQLLVVAQMDAGIITNGCFAISWTEAVM